MSLRWELHGTKAEILLCYCYGCLSLTLAIWRWLFHFGSGKGEEASRRDSQIWVADLAASWLSPFYLL